MKVRELVYWPDLRLAQRSRPLDLTQHSDTALLEKLVGEMFEAMDFYGGIGLAAVQIGEPVALIVTKDKKVPGARTWYANPRIVQLGGTPKLMREGCLSAPGIFEEIRRYPIVKLVSERATFDEKGLRGVEVHTSLRGQAAHVLQHECEHLAGEFFFRHLSGLRRARAAAKLTNRR